MTLSLAGVLERGSVDFAGLVGSLGRYPYLQRGMMHVALAELSDFGEAGGDKWVGNGAEESSLANSLGNSLGLGQ